MGKGGESRTNISHHNKLTLFLNRPTADYDWRGSYNFGGQVTWTRINNKFTENTILNFKNDGWLSFLGAWGGSGIYSDE